MVSTINLNETAFSVYKSEMIMYKMGIWASTKQKKSNAVLLLVKYFVCACQLPMPDQSYECGTVVEIFSWGIPDLLRLNEIDL